MAAWPARADGFDAVVGPDGFVGLSAALAAAPPGDAPYRILLRKGVWREKLTIARANVWLTGEDRQASILTYDAAAGDEGPDGAPLGTRGCASLIVRAPGFRVTGLTIANRFDYAGNLQNPNYEKTGANGLQAVALMLDRGADRCAFERVDILGHQDTLFADAGRALFRDCRIAGSVDFIFGAGRVAFERCAIVSRYRPSMQRNQGWVAAPSTPLSQPFGYVFFDCRLEREASVPPASVVLGRPWRPTRSFADGRFGDPQAVGAATYLHCWMDDHLSADGWDEMGYVDRSGAHLFLEPLQARFAEFGSRGPGAFRNRRRPWLSPGAAQSITPARVLGGWHA